MYKVIREDDSGRKRKERDGGTKAEGERKKERKKQQTTRTRINGLSYYFHYGYNEVLMARRSDESKDCVGKTERRAERPRERERETGDEGDERPTQADGDGRIEKNHLATGHYNNT